MGMFYGCEALRVLFQEKKESAPRPIFLAAGAATREGGRTRGAGAGTGVFSS